jgi:hypothetical protein
MDIFRWTPWPLSAIKTALISPSRPAGWRRHGAPSEVQPDSGVVYLLGARLGSDAAGGGSQCLDPARRDEPALRAVGAVASATESGCDELLAAALIGFPLQETASPHGRLPAPAQRRWQAGSCGASPGAVGPHERRGPAARVVCLRQWRLWPGSPYDTHQVIELPRLEMEVSHSRAITGSKFEDFDLYWSQARAGCCPWKKLLTASTKT